MPQYSYPFSCSTEANIYIHNRLISFSPFVTCVCQRNLIHLTEEEGHWTKYLKEESTLLDPILMDVNEVVWEIQPAEEGGQCRVLVSMRIALGDLQKEEWPWIS
jgi:hypothetical protein